MLGWVFFLGVLQAPLCFCYSPGLIASKRLVYRSVSLLNCEVSEGRECLPYLPWYPQHSACHTVGLKQYVRKEERRNGEKDRWQGEGRKEGRIVEVQTME